MQQTIMIWCEDELKNQLSAQDRRNLSKADHFAIWTIPPGSTELIDALAKVNPKTIYLFSVDPGTDHPEHFLRKLTGLVKHVLKEKRGMANIYELSALTSQRRICVEAGLDWLATYGYINILDKNTEYIHIGKGNGIKRETTEPATIRLRALLNESAAYRSYYTRTDKDKLISPYMAGINLKKS